MKTIAIYFSQPGAMDYPFNELWFFDAYKDIIASLEAKGPRVVIVRADSYQGKGVFSQYFRIEEDEVIKHDEPVTVDLIWNRDNENTIPVIHDCLVLNHPDFDELCTDKYKTAQQFPDISPKTDYVHSYEQYRNTIALWHLPEDTRIVLKKNYLHSGRGIFILPLSDIHEGLYDDWSDILVQQFVESSDGLPGISDGRHDLRVYVLSGIPAAGMVRVAKEGEFLANADYGSTLFTVDVDQIEQEVLDHVAYINKNAVQYEPTIYGADFLKGNDGKYYLVELNSRVGLGNPEWKQYEAIRDGYVNCLLTALTHT